MFELLENLKWSLNISFHLNDKRYSLKPGKFNHQYQIKDEKNITHSSEKKFLSV